jgi:hypothetical protein
MLPGLNNINTKVATRDISWSDLCTRAWGTEWRAPDHRVYRFSGNNFKDSTDLTTNGFYRRGK